MPFSSKLYRLRSTKGVELSAVLRGRNHRILIRWRRIRTKSGI